MLYSSGLQPSFFYTPHPFKSFTMFSHPLQQGWAIDFVRDQKMSALSNQLKLNLEFIGQTLSNHSKFFIELS